MSRIQSSLAVRLFVAIAATAVAVVAIMALLVALSMRDGFARYLLRGELSRFDNLATALAQDFATTPGWADLAANPAAWGDLVREYDMRPARPEPASASDKPGPRPPAGPPGMGGLPMLERLTLLGAAGNWIAGAPIQSGMIERRTICADGDCAVGPVLGYLALRAPLTEASSGDRFFLRGQYASLGLAALIAIGVSALAAWFVSRQILIPIRHLAAGAKTMAAGDYTARIPQDRTDELGQLVGHYNALAATLERTDKAEREWMSNTSHELQTPLATLRAQIEAVQDGIRVPNALTMAAMHSAVLRLSRLVQDIKTLSHTREGGMTATMRPEDLCHIVLDVTEVVKPHLADKNLTFSLDMPSTAPLICDRIRIGQVVDNLMQNAARYTNAPGTVRLRIVDAGNAFHLTVDDTPPGPDPQDIPRLFERFYRAESSRSRAYGGSGLGLSVCQAILESHGGTISASLSELGGLCVAIILPKGPA
ncbi:ATP-binding protein [Loktanella salsilacus]|uniref:ATP-binding protein n=1 Tax=Loktanella salsilacus TaxID=195913 RepID=UPI0037362E6B